MKVIVKDLNENIRQKIDTFEEKKKKNLKNFKINRIISAYIITNEIKRFFTSNQLSQLMDEINPLSEITHKRKVSAFGIGAVDKKKANLNIREIHPSHFGRICPIETAEGKNAGLILSLAKNVYINKHGMIKSPFYLWLYILI